MTTEIAIKSVLDGSTKEFEHLVSDNNELLYRVGMSYVNNHAEVEDLMQVCYIKSFENLNTYNGKSSFSTWLTRIMINECLMHIRKRKTELYGNSEIAKLFDYAENASVETDLNYEQLKKITENILTKIPEDYRIVFVLREVQNLSVKEVADALEISADNVKVRMHRARQMLQKMILKKIGEADIFEYHKKYCSVLTKTVMSKIIAKNCNPS